MNAQAAKQRVWSCPYCNWLIETNGDTYEVGINHLLDEHAPRLIEERPVILRDRKERTP